MAWFEEIRRLHPNHSGTKAALRHFLASVKSESDFEAIKKAHATYMRTDKVTRGFIQNFSTWVNNWRDYLDWLDPKEQDRQARERALAVRRQEQARKSGEEKAKALEPQALHDVLEEAKKKILKK